MIFHMEHKNSHATSKMPANQRGPASLARKHIDAPRLGGGFGTGAANHRAPNSRSSAIPHPFGFAAKPNGPARHPRIDRCSCEILPTSRFGRQLQHEPVYLQHQQWHRLCDLLCCGRLRWRPSLPSEAAPSRLRLSTPPPSALRSSPPDLVRIPLPKNLLLKKHPMALFLLT